MRASETTAEPRRKREPYLCFLLRCRLEVDGGQPAWRFTVQQVGQGAARRSFASFSDLATYVRAELASCEAFAGAGGSTTTTAIVRSQSEVKP